MSRVYVTGGNGLLRASVVEALATLAPGRVELVVSRDLREPRHPLAASDEKIIYKTADVTDPAVVLEQFRRHRVHVDGSRNVLDACIATGERRLIVSSSGAAYGYQCRQPGLAGGNRRAARQRRVRVLTAQAAR